MSSVAGTAELTAAEATCSSTGRAASRRHSGAGHQTPRRDPQPADAGRHHAFRGARIRAGQHRTDLRGRRYTRGAFYSNFDSVDELFFALYQNARR